MSIPTADVEKKIEDLRGQCVALAGLLKIPLDESVRNLLREKTGALALEVAALQKLIDNLPTLPSTLGGY